MIVCEEILASVNWSRFSRVHSEEKALGSCEQIYFIHIPCFSTDDPIDSYRFVAFIA